MDLGFTSRADNASAQEMDNIRLYTCMVGKKPTHANFYVNEVSEVEAVLAVMAGGDSSVLEADLVDAMGAVAIGPDVDENADEGGEHGGAEGGEDQGPEARIDALAG